MATTMIPPAPTPAPRPSPGPDAVRFLSIHADLLPDEVRSARQTVALRKRVLLALCLVVALLAGWYGYSWWQTSSARNDLSAAQQQGLALQHQVDGFTPLVRAQAQAQAIQTQLRGLMTGDLSWQQLLSTLRAKAPRGVRLTAVTATVNAKTTAVATPGLNESGSPSVGQLTVTGTAPDKKTTAAYADALGSVKGLTAPLITNITTANNSVTFSVSLTITRAALGGRFTTATTGGR